MKDPIWIVKVLTVKSDRELEKCF